MALLVIPIWRGSDGHDEGPIYPAAASDVEVGRLIDRGLREARHAKGTNVRVLVVDDLTWRRVAVVRPREGA